MTSSDKTYQTQNPLKISGKKNISALFAKRNTDDQIQQTSQTDVFIIDIKKSKVKNAKIITS